MIDEHELLVDLLKDNIKMMYGAVEDVDEGQGGFTYKRYLQYKIDDQK